METVYGFYGGKFMPLHKGHLYCIDTAAKMCDHVTVIMFINGDDELKIRKTDKDEMLSVEARTAQLERVCELYPGVEFHIIDDEPLRDPDGSENWDKETPLVRQYVPYMDYVFSSEPQYGAYFSRAYPEATHIIVDAKRTKYPISGTMIRAMELMEDKKKWMV
ncbi:MAG: adenylyltransferase/cytidyltransferase family protein [Saccharofermentans sp.]|nr:adenylyltransferase/cytidyltransferase family protein [Saccharofermentans sp.]